MNPNRLNLAHFWREKLRESLESRESVNLLGFGKIMQSLAKILAPCDIYDDKFASISQDSNENRLLPANQINAANRASLSVISPGIPPDSSLAKNAPNLISEYDLFAPFMPPSAWISGTNGKTTTTEMSALLLREFGAQSGGNIGVPLCEMDSRAKFWVLETSSFMLHYTNRATPRIYALLPIEADHISWHGSFEIMDGALF